MMNYASAIAFVVLVGWLISRYDRAHALRLPAVMATIVAGMLLMWGLGYVEDLTHWLFGTTTDHNGATAAIAASHEEAANLAAITLIGTALGLRRSHPIRGLLCGSYLGLGMATFESMMYLHIQGCYWWSTDTPAISLLGPEIIRMVLHTLWGGISGYATGMAATCPTPAQRPKTPLWLLPSFAMVLHFLWDYLVGTYAASGGAFPIDGRITSICLMLASIFAFGWLVKDQANKSLITLPLFAIFIGRPLRLVNVRSSEIPSA